MVHRPGLILVRTNAFYQNTRNAHREFKTGVEDAVQVFRELKNIRKRLARRPVFTVYRSARIQVSDEATKIEVSTKSIVTDTLSGMFVTLEKVHRGNVTKEKAKADALAKNGFNNKKQAPDGKARGEGEIGASSIRSSPPLSLPKVQTRIPSSSTEEAFFSFLFFSEMVRLIFMKFFVYIW